MAWPARGGCPAGHDTCGASAGPLRCAWDADETRRRKREHGLGQLEGLDEAGAFLDTAAVMRCLDLVVCVDTAVGHVAGALGVPCWLALAGVCDWRWLRGRDDTVWYPRHRLFRQEEQGDWGGVFAEMASELAALARGRGRGLVRLEVSAVEYLDRLTIARLKSERIADPEKRAAVAAELASLEAAGGGLRLGAEEASLAARLAEVNGRLWDVEDGLRGREAAQDFGEGFVELARSVYKLNDERGALKRELSGRLGAAWSEQKQYGGRG